MSPMLLVLGLALLYCGALFFVRGASYLALILGVSPLLIGLTVVALGTSSPEIWVTALSSYRGETNLTLGNLIGSNIFNTLFIIGLSALIRPLKVHRNIVRSEILISFAVTLAVYFLALNGLLTWGDGLVLILIGLGYLFYIIQHAKDLEVEPIPRSKSKSRMVLSCLFGLILLFIGAELVVYRAIAIAHAAGISTLAIGLTVVAIGTSLPELATSAMAAYKREPDIAIGNIIGSNIYNITLILGLTPLLSPHPVPVSTALLQIDFPILLFAILISIPMFLTGKRITRLEGGFLVLLYAAYLSYAYFD